MVTQVTQNPRRNHGPIFAAGLGGYSKRTDQRLRVLLANVVQQLHDQPTDQVARRVQPGDELRNHVQPGVDAHSFQAIQYLVIHVRVLAVVEPQGQ